LVAEAKLISGAPGIVGLPLVTLPVALVSVVGEVDEYVIDVTAPEIPKLLKVATPVFASTVDVVVPSNEPPLLLALIGRVPKTVLFHASVTVICGCVKKVEAEAVPTGCRVKSNFEAAPGAVRVTISVTYKLNEVVPFHRR
jgi:hypothetical protein